MSTTDLRRVVGGATDTASGMPTGKRQHKPMIYDGGGFNGAGATGSW